MSRQLVGRVCVLCGERISSILDGRCCDQCGSPVHHKCIGRSDLPKAKTPCSTCGGDPLSELPPQHLLITDPVDRPVDHIAFRPETPSAGRMMPPRYSRFVGNVLVLFAGFVLITGMVLPGFLQGLFPLLLAPDGFGTQILAIAVFTLLFGVATWFYLLGKKLIHKSAHDLIYYDNRQPIIILRSFRDDEAWYVLRRPWLTMVIGPIATFFNWVSFEEALAGHLSRYGPVIAIGRPGERYATLGAAREYLGDDKWQERVLELVPRCRSIILMIGTTGGLAWEMEQLIRLNLLEKVILLFPPVKSSNMKMRWKAFRLSTASLGLPSVVGDDAILGLVDGKLRLHIIGHDNMKRQMRFFRPTMSPYIDCLNNYFNDKLSIIKGKGYYPWF